MEIYLVRHTKVDVIPNTCYGFSDVPLNSDFERDAGRIKSLLPNPNSLAIYTSTLSRCTRLSNAINKNTIRLHDDRLKELNFGDWEMKTWDEVPSDAFKTWQEDIALNRVPGGESFQDLQDRAISFWNEIVKEEPEPIAIVTHGGIIRAYLAYFLGFPLRNAFRIKMDYGTVTKLSLVNGNTFVHYINK